MPRRELTDSFRDATDLSITMVYPPRQAPPENLTAKLEIYDSNARSCFRGIWDLHTTESTTGTLRPLEIRSAGVEGAADVSIEARTLPDGQQALVFSVRIERIPPGRYAPVLCLTDSHDVTAVWHLAEFALEAPRFSLQLSDITMRSKLEDGSVVANPVNLLWAGRSTLIAEAELHQLALRPDGKPASYDIRYALFPKAVYDSEIAARIENADIGRSGKRLPDVLAQKSVGGSWIRQDLASGSSPSELIILGSGDSTGTRFRGRPGLQRPRSVVFATTLGLGEHLDPGSYVLLVEAHDAISQEVTHRALDFAVVPSDYVIPPPGQP